MTSQARYAAELDKFGKHLGTTDCHLREFAFTHSPAQTLVGLDALSAVDLLRKDLPGLPRITRRRFALSYRRALIFGFDKSRKDPLPVPIACVNFHRVHRARDCSQSRASRTAGSILPRYLKSNKLVQICKSRYALSPSLAQRLGRLI